jgi:hypothetical protein
MRGMWACAPCESSSAAAAAAAAAVKARFGKVSMQWCEWQVTDGCGRNSRSSRIVAHLCNGGPTRCTLRVGPPCSAIYGGASKAAQGREMRQYRPHVLVATPGRLLDLVNDLEVDLSGVGVWGGGWGGRDG